MAEEQVIRSELPPTSAKSDNKSGQEEFSDEELKRIAFWIERVAAFLLFLCLFPITYHIFFPAMSICLLVVSNYLYIETYMSPQVIRAKTTPPSVVNIDNKSGGGGELIKGQGFAFWIERVASFLAGFGWLRSYKCQHVVLHLATCLFCISSIFYTFLDEKKAKLDDSAKEVKEEVKAKDGRISGIDEENADKQKAKLDDIAKETKEEVKAKFERINEDEENTEQEKGKLDFGLKESKEEEAKDESMNTGKETTGQHKARLEVSLKELKEEARSFGKEFQSVEGKYLAKIKKRVDKLQKSFDKFHEWEEERSQLMYELGAARASVGIYRELLHDLHYH